MSGYRYLKLENLGLALIVLIVLGLLSIVVVLGWVVSWII